MAVYVVGCFLTLITSHIFNRIKHNKDTVLRDIIIALFSAFPLIYIASIRYNVGQDFFTYVNLFKRIANGTNIYPVELLYRWLNELIAYFHGDYPWVFALSAILFLVFTFLCIKNDSPYYGLSVFLLVTSGYYFVFFNAMRQLVGCAILLWAIHFAQERKIIPFSAFVLIATGFHTTSILFFPVYFLANRKLNRRLIIGIAITAFALSGPISNLLVRLLSLTQYAYYIGGRFDTESQGFVTLAINIAIVIFTTIYYDEQDEKYKLYYNIQAISLCLSAFVGQVVLIHRIRWMYGLPSIILLPLAISKIEDKKMRMFVSCAVVLLYAIYFYIIIGINNSNNVLPYDTIFNNGF